ncbi:hypothetical protein EXW35_12000 [Bacillus mycoides]|uniref:hypothetical protein n=1 Tax=Bacillus mycoides TaxID=1405 RepID=UPI001C02602D|nr:hypothetical protein [Bacillus mycoides]QWG39129.1 hypothetical protein EXW35_12000 [Bacillus mycoides]
MKYLQVIISLSILGVFMYSQESFALTNEDVPFLINNGTCPKPQEVGHVSSDEGLIEALNTIIPQVYKGEDYKGWKIETIAYLPKGPHPESYYAMAKHYCGEKIAKNSWFVEVLFPQYLPAYDASHRQIFVTKNKQGQWFAWFRFH